MNTNAYIIVKEYKVNNRCDGFNLSTYETTQALEIQSNQEEFNIESFRLEDCQRKMEKKRKISFQESSTVFMMLANIFKEHVNFVYVMIALLTTF